MINEPTPDAEATFRRRPLDCFPHATLPTRVPPFWPIVTLPTRKSEHARELSPREQDLKHTGFLDDEKGGSLDGRAPRRVLQGRPRHGLDVDPEPLVLREALAEPPEQLGLARELEELLDVF